ncbi:MAG: hypothetical protein EHM85_17640 [Desulfobacteraceae bacterium]|nr:MAG: hypothetical protein EHM85_17640 [Desulfobacteraceae bacterium]
MLRGTDAVFGHDYPQYHEKPFEGFTICALPDSMPLFSPFEFIVNVFCFQAIGNSSVGGIFLPGKSSA